MSSGRFGVVGVLVRCYLVIFGLSAQFRSKFSNQKRINRIPTQTAFLTFISPYLLCFTVPRTWHPFQAAHVVTRTAAPVFSGYAIIARTLALTVRQVAS